MNYTEARRLLLVHGSGTVDDQGNAVWLDDGFLGMLRPYRGLGENNFHVVMEALLVVGEQLHAADQVDRQLVYSLWEMCRLARIWGIEPDGMLQRNHLITPDDTALLARWIEVVEYCALQLLGGRPPAYAINGYAEYVVERGYGDNIAFFVPLMQRYLDDPDRTDPEPIPQALGKLGPLAASALPSLRAASQRKYADYCHAEAQEAIAEAIRRIGG